MKKIIGVDASPLVRKNYSGTEWYLFNLIKTLPHMSQSEQFEWYLYLPKSPSRLLQLPQNWTWKILKWPLGHFWLQGRLSLEMILNAPDLLFMPANSMPLVTATLNLTTIHDIAFLDYPHLFSRKERLRQLWSTRRALAVCNYVLTISKSTKNEIIKNYHPSPDTIIVSPLAIDTSLYTPTLNEQKHSTVKSPYILFVGRLCRKKNIGQLIEIFEKIAGKENFDNISLCLIGADGFGSQDIYNRVLKSIFKERIIILHWQTEKRLINFISDAAVLVLPSFAEGFGLPILEAQALNIPVVCSDIPALRETAGDGALFFSLAKPNDLKDAILSVLKNNFLKEELVEKGRSNFKKFNLVQTAKKTLEAIEQSFLRSGKKELKQG